MSDEGAIFHFDFRIIKSKKSAAAVNTIIIVLYFFKKESIIIRAVNSWKTGFPFFLQSYHLVVIHIKKKVIHRPGCREQWIPLVFVTCMWITMVGKVFAILNIFQCEFRMENYQYTDSLDKLWGPV